MLRVGLSIVFMAMWLLGASGLEAATWSAEVAEVQRLLTAHGYDPGPVDGLMGSKTQAAIQRFERDQGLVVSGELSTSLLAALRKTGHKSADTHRQIVIPDEARSKYPDLIPQILASPSMDDADKNYWFSVLPIMTEDQIAELRDILASEKRQLDALGQKQHVQPEVVTLPTLISGRYQDNGNGTVTDRLTGLIWKRCLEGQKWAAHTCKGEATRITPIAVLHKSWPKFAGSNDWRLPTSKELISLVYCSNGAPAETIIYGCIGHRAQYGHSQSPTIDTAAFPMLGFNNMKIPCWARKGSGGNQLIDDYSDDEGGFMAVIDFLQGKISNLGRTDRAFVRLVRGR